MLFLIRIIAGTIIGVVAGIWVARGLNFTPPHLRTKYSILLQAIFTVVYSIVLTFLYFENAYLGWTIIIALSFLTWLFSAKLTSWFAHYRKESLQTGAANSASN